jgi:ABC-type multidrug transport system fused ATPase/permease subunit
MSFFDTTPLGRINNRFSKDIYTVDEQLPQTVRWYLQSLAKVSGAVLYVCVVSPLFILGLVPIYLYYMSTQRYYIRTSRELARLDSISRSPIYALFSETIDGLSTVRSFRMESQLTERSDGLLDANQRAYFLTFSSNCWLGFRLEFVGTVIVVAAASLAVMGRPTQASGVADAGAGKAGTFAGLCNASNASALPLSSATLRLHSRAVREVVASSGLRRSKR